jgi:hypothetical protein
MAWGYIIGGIAGGIMARNAKKAEKARKRNVAEATTQGILDLQPLYQQYREDAARAAGLRFTQQGLAMDQAQAGYLSNAAGIASTGFAGYSNPSIVNPAAGLVSLGLQSEASLLDASQALSNRLGSIDAAERQLRASALQSGVVLDTTEQLVAQDKIKKQEKI